jgi:hypothetical protein
LDGLDGLDVIKSSLLSVVERLGDTVKKCSRMCSLKDVLKDLLIARELLKFLFRMLRSVEFKTEAVESHCVVV